jgi:hypothetical protein
VKDHCQPAYELNSLNFPFVFSKHIDDPWFTIAKAVVAGKLGFAAKVSTKETIGKSHVVCIYNDDFTDDADVTRVEKGLRDVGIHSELQYKPDIYTVCGIYAKNDLGISPIIFKSKAVDMAHANGMDYQWRKGTGDRKEHGMKQGDWMNNDCKESLDSFLEKNKPSQISNRDEPWISVSCDHGQQDVGQELESKYDNRDLVPLIKTEWEELIKRKPMKLFTAEVLKDLAVKYKYTSGKWMIFASRFVEKLKKNAFGQ